LFSWRRLEVGSDLFFGILSGFAVVVVSFSVKHRSHRLEMLLYGLARLIIYSPFNVQVLIIVT